MYGYGGLRSTFLKKHYFKRGASWRVSVPEPPVGGGAGAGTSPLSAWTCSCLSSLMVNSNVSWPVGDGPSGPAPEAGAVGGNAAEDEEGAVAQGWTQHTAAAVVNGYTY